MIKNQILPAVRRDTAAPSEKSEMHAVMTEASQSLAVA